jgi:hypothetical protein
MLATSAIFKKLPKVNARPVGENSPNLVILWLHIYTIPSSEVYYIKQHFLALPLFLKNGRSIITDDHLLLG